MNINWKLECLGKVMCDDGDKSGLEYEMECLSCLMPVKSGCTRACSSGLDWRRLGKRRPKKVPRLRALPAMLNF
jgi:hypothetical protein